MKKLPLQERVRQRLRALVNEKHTPLEILSEHLGLSKSGVSRILNDEDYAILWQHLEGFCVFFQVTPAEIIADPDAVIQPVTPIEAALLRIVRGMTELERRSLLTLLDRPVVVSGRTGRLGRPMLSVKEQELVDLYARSNDQAREGVLKVLRGAAKFAAQDRKQTT